MEDRDDRLAEQREERRDFLRKLALGTAYAVPLMATFSLDSVRNKASAQVAYADPRVIDARQDPSDWQSALIDFDQPMMQIGDTGGDTRLANGPCVDRTESFTNWGEGDSFFWKWTSPTQLRLTTSGWGGGDVYITFNTQNNSCTDFRGMNGRLLVPWSGTVNMPD